MVLLEVKEIGIRRKLRDKLLDTKPLKEYAQRYVEFAIRLSFSSVLENVDLISAKWNESEMCWEGIVRSAEREYHWVLK